MKYGNYTIEKQLDGRYKIFEKFNIDATKHSYKSIKEAKGVIDNVLSKEDRTKNRYMPIHYRQYWWAIIDKTTQLYVKREDDETKMLMFKGREECFAWCKEHNESLVK